MELQNEGGGIEKNDYESFSSTGSIDVVAQNVDVDDHNRTMVLQVDRTDLRLISPDRKIILLHKQHRDITTCIQGVNKSEHFGFVCREGATLQNFIGYIFKCESSSISSDAVAGNFNQSLFTLLSIFPFKYNMIFIMHFEKVYHVLVSVANAKFCALSHYTLKESSSRR